MRHTPLGAAPRTKRRPSLGWQIARIVLAGSRRQAFLDHGWIWWLLRAVPASRRRAVALRILSLSPHYFVYQWERYPLEWPRRRVLEAESARNRDTRRQIAALVLASKLSNVATVLDFGCGPGFLAKEIHGRGREVIGMDVSAGTLACASVLNPGPTYRLNRTATLPLPDASIDLVYSIAVLQHIDPARWPDLLAEFARVLRPGGRGVCHVVVAEQAAVRYCVPAGLRGFYSLRFEECSIKDIAGALSRAGFVDVRVEPVADEAGIDDDVGRQHVATFSKPPTASTS